MKKAFSAIGIAFAFIIISLVALYLLLGKYYSDGFSCSTWVNGVYCTGKTVEEVNRELVSRNVYPGINLYGPDGKELFIGASDVDLKLDYTQALETILKNQNPYAWGLNIFKNLYVQYEPIVSFNEDKFSEIVLSWDIFENEDDLRVAIDSTNDGYILVNGLTHIPNMDHIVAASRNAMYNMEISIDLMAYENTFTDIPLSTDDKKTVALYEKLEPLLNCDITFNVLGIEIPVSRKDAGEFLLREDELSQILQSKDEKKKKTDSELFIVSGNTGGDEDDDVINLEEELPDIESLTSWCGFVLDENGNPLISEKKLKAYAQKLADDHDTSWLMEEYREGLGSEIIISDNKKGNGNLFDVNTAFDVLKSAYLTNTQDAQQSIELSLLDNAKVYDANESLGKTYIEVNMGEQMLTYYVDGQLNMEMPIVTGNVNRSRGTPTGIFSVYNKRYHTYLRGVDYVSYVNYWLGVNKGVGIHDANWRSEFGSDIYKRDGSHGCINCPEEKASKLWEVVDVGTPVVLYY
ncbi:MAG: L,D-transpeptidase [Butyrivibrio sp.]|nr:L,D-transpeptidase [Butyrivibrio sp.]